MPRAKKRRRRSAGVSSAKANGSAQQRVQVERERIVPRSRGSRLRRRAETLKVRAPSQLYRRLGGKVAGGLHLWSRSHGGR